MNRKVLISVGVALVVAIAAFWGYQKLAARWEIDQIESEKEEILASFNESEDKEPLQEAPIDNAPKEIVEEPEQELPERVLLNVQFIAQGPLSADAAHWDIHAESCEEAASLMVHNYVVGATVTPKEAENIIFDLVDWQVANFGDEHDIYPDEVKLLLEGYWGHTDVEVVQIQNAEDLKSLLAAGDPVIAPTVAKYLHNPRYYDQDYHMIAVTGYTPDRFITNDNGTTWGEDYPYPYSDLLEAILATGGEVVVIHS